MKKSEKKAVGKELAKLQRNFTAMSTDKLEQLLVNLETLVQNVEAHPAEQPEQDGSQSVDK